MSYNKNIPFKNFYSNIFFFKENLIQGDFYMKEEKKLLEPKIDIVFQSLFSKNNIKITKSFVQALLEEKVNSIIINEDKELIRERPNDKLGILDLQLDVNGKEKVDVEIQLLKRTDFTKRLLWYLTRMYSSQINRGNKYNQLKKVVLIAIIDFELEQTKEFNEMETIWNFIETKKREKILTEDLEVRIIELNKAKDMYKSNKKDEKAQWMLFLDNPNSKEVKIIMKENDEINDAVIKVKEMTEDEKMERLAFLRQKAIMDEDGIREAGYEDGEKNAKKEIAKKLLREGKDIEYIKELTRLSEEEIKSI